jgi:hypothetical protein
MSWLFSRALVAEFSEARSSAGELSARSSATPIAPAFLCKDRTTEFWRRFPSGMTCEPLTATLGEAVLTWCQEVFLARTFPAPEKAAESTENAADFGASSHGSLAKYDRASSSWRTCQLSLFGGLDEFSETWPRWGMMRAGECWALSTPELLTGGSGSGLWPTPRAEEGYQGDGAAQAYLDAGCKQPKERNGKQRGKSTFDTTLTTAVAAKLWPTPTEACATGGQTSRGGNRKNELLLSGMVKMFPTPTSGDAKASGSRNTENSNAHPGLSLTDFVRQDGGKGRTWSTPTANLRDAWTMEQQRTSG